MQRRDPAGDACCKGVALTVRWSMGKPAAWLLSALVDRSARRSSTHDINGAVDGTLWKALSSPVSALIDCSDSANG